MMFKDTDQFAKRRPTGVYDTKILCKECDNSFSDWENYSARLLYEIAPLHFPFAQSGLYQILDYDYSRLKLCLLSILWRMSITSKTEYAGVSLGSHYETIMKGMLIAKDPGPANMFSIVMLQLTDYIGSQSALGTGSNRHQHSRMYNLGLPGFVAVIKVGQIDHPHAFPQFVMSPGMPLYIALKENKLEDDWKPAFQKVQAIYGPKQQ